MLQQHPSVVVELARLLPRRGEILSMTATTRSLDIVLTRCFLPVQPILRMVPAMVSHGSLTLRARAVVYERCAPGEHLQELPHLDVRDLLPRVRRIVLRSNATADATEAGLAEHAWLAARAQVKPADFTLLLLPAGVEAFSELPPSRDETLASRRVSVGPVALDNQRALQKELREEWARIVPPLPPWTSATGEAGTLSRCVATALDRLTAADSNDRHSGGILTITLPPSSHNGGRRVAALLARRSAVAETVRSAPDLPSAWRRLRAAASPFDCAAASVPHGGGEACASVPTDNHASATRSGAAGRARGVEAAWVGWPANASLVGFCGVTNEGVEGDCNARQSKGSWNTRHHRIRSFSDCVGRCVMCRRCSYVTYSPDNDDCSWYTHRECNLKALGQDDAFRTVMVTRNNRDKGPPTAATTSPGSVVGDARVAAAHLSYVCALRADRQWARDLLSGAVGILADEIGRQGDAAADSTVAAESDGAGVEGGGGAARLRGVPVVHPSCVEGDFMLHNRQLLPLPPASASAAGVAPQAQSCVASLRGGGPTRRATATAAAAAACADGSSRWRAPISSRARPWPGDAAAALSATIKRANANAAASSCRADRGARMELHLSGFFSMVNSMLKPWTAALRMGRSLMTPTAPGLFDPRGCERVSGGQVGWSCHFERIAPQKCESASHAFGRFLFNLPEQHREGPADAHPSRTRSATSAPWWCRSSPPATAAARLTRAMPAARRASGLSAAPRRARRSSACTSAGDACIAAEIGRTARLREPLAVYMESVAAYASAVGARTVFLATDSEQALADGARLFPRSPSSTRPT